MNDQKREKTDSETIQATMEKTMASLTISRKLWKMPETRKSKSCSLCGGTGWEMIVQKYPELYGPDHSGDEFAVPCRKCNGKRQSYQEENRKRLVLPHEHTINYFNPNIYKDAEGNRIDFSKYYEFILKYLSHYEDVVKDTEMNGLYIYSEVAGNGKTLLASIICYELFLRYQMMPYYVKENELLEKIDKNVSDMQISVRDQFRKAPIFFIDDMWRKKSGRDWVDDELFGIIDYRYTHKLPVIVTSNVSLSSDKIDTRIASRLNRMCVPIHIPDVEVRNMDKQQRRKELIDTLANAMEKKRSEENQEET